MFTRFTRHSTPPFLPRALSVRYLLTRALGFRWRDTSFLTRFGFDINFIKFVLALDSGFKRSEIDEEALSVSKQLEATKFGEEAGPQKNLEFLLISPTLYRPSKALSVLSTFTFHLQLTPLAGSKESRSFENSYIPENPKTPKPLTFSKNRLRGAKNRSILSPVAKKNFRKNKFFFSKTLHMGKFFFFAYMHGFVKKKFEKKRKKKVAYMQKKKKKVAYMQQKKISFFSKFFSANFNYYERFGESRSRFFERNNGLGDIGNWGSSRVLGNI
ncbi:hypothetical protein LXL04_027017 [Taraxacum kok-saghyz]